MGERTQLLIRVNDKQKQEEVFSTMIHYQWGFGRVMLMDAFNMAINFPTRDDLSKVSDEFVATAGFGKNVKGIKEAYYNWIEKTTKGVMYYKKDSDIAYKTTKKHLWIADNNDGYLILDVDIDREHEFSPDVRLSFYTHRCSKGKFIIEKTDFFDWCRKSDGNYYTDTTFRDGYRKLTKSFGIELDEPDQREVVYTEKW